MNIRSNNNNNNIFLHGMNNNLTHLDKTSFLSATKYKEVCGVNKKKKFYLFNIPLVYLYFYLFIVSLLFTMVFGPKSRYIIRYLFIIIFNIFLFIYDTSLYLFYIYLFTILLYASFIFIYLQYLFYKYSISLMLLIIICPMVFDPQASPK